jgi:hypothetical protein
MSRARSRLPLAGWALLIVAVGGLAFWRLQPGPQSPAHPGLDADRAGRLDGADARRAPAHPANVPKLVPASLDEISDTTADDGPEAAAGNDDLDASERAEIDRIEQAIRAEAAAAVGLTIDQRAQLDAIRADFDVRRRRFEAQIDPTTRMLEPLASAAILGNARAEHQQIGRALGPERAAALSEAERLAWARVRTGRADAGVPRPSPAASRMLARRLSGAPSRSPGPPTAIAP